MFLDPVAQAIIKNEQTGRTWDWTAPDYPFLTGLTITWAMEATGVISLSIEAPYEDGIAKLLTPPSPFAVGNVIQARIGYASGLFTDWAVGINNAGGDGIGVDASGISGSVTFKMGTRHIFYTTPKDIPKEGTLTDLLTFIAEYMGLTLYLGPRAQEVADNERLDSDYILHSVTGQSKTVYELLKEICTDENLRWMLGPNPYKEVGDTTRYLIIMRDEEIFDLAQRVNRRKYVMRGVVDVANNQYPLLSWAPEGAAFASWFANTPDPSAGGVAGYFTDMGYGQVDEFEVLPGDLDMKTFGFLAEQEPLDFVAPDIVADRKRSEEVAAELLGQPVKAGPDGKKQAEKKAAKKAVDGNASQTGVIATIGVPEERCENLCDVKGLGVLYDGVYEIRKIAHVYSPGAYDMSLTVMRGGTGHEKSDGGQEETAGGQAE